jgi:hypothetical protein
MKTCKENSPCIIPLGGGRYQCKNNDWTITTDVLPIHCSCESLALDPVAWFTTRHADLAHKPTTPPLPDILARLDRCLSSGCPDLIGNVCTIYEGSDCKRLAAWFGRLLRDDCE